MGEYVKLNGTIIKLGTCEDLYYARFNQIKDNLARMTKVDGNDEPAGYLDPAHGYRYRFPFPDEDNLKLGNYEDFDRGLLIGASYDVLEGIEHDKICRGTACQGGFNVNHCILCPADPAFVPTCNPRTDRAPVEIVQQKQVDGQLWTVFRCGWCQAKFRLPKDKAEKLCVAIQEQHQDGDWQEVTRRIMGGYEMTL